MKLFGLNKTATKALVMAGVAAVLLLVLSYGVAAALATIVCLMVLASPAVLGAVIYRIFVWKANGRQPGRAVPAVLSAIAAVLLLVLLLVVSAGPHPTDGSAMAAWFIFMFGAPIVAIVAAVFGAGVGQR